MWQARRRTTIIGGATLWVLRDRPRAEYKGNRLLRQFERTNPDQSTVDNELILSIA
jgi:hypothetical protein